MTLCAPRVWCVGPWSGGVRGDAPKSRCTRICDSLFGRRSVCLGRCRILPQAVSVDRASGGGRWTGGIWSRVGGLSIRSADWGILINDADKTSHIRVPSRLLVGGAADPYPHLHYWSPSRPTFQPVGLGDHPDVRLAGLPTARTRAEGLAPIQPELDRGDDGEEDAGADVEDRVGGSATEVEARYGDQAYQAICGRVCSRVWV